MDKNKVYLTEKGFQKIQQELSDLKNKVRPRVVERLSLARTQGDLTENNEYASAKEELAFIDGRIDELEEVLKKVTLINGSHKGCKNVGLGCKVTVRNGKGEFIYQIVGEWEADPVVRKVSCSSPLGQALLDRKVGDEIEFDAPAGKTFFRVTKIE